MSRVSSTSYVEVCRSLSAERFALPDRPLLQTNSAPLSRTGSTKAQFWRVPCICLGKRGKFPLVGEAVQVPERRLRKPTHPEHPCKIIAPTPSGRQLLGSLWPKYFWCPKITGPASACIQPTPIEECWWKPPERRFSSCRSVSIWLLLKLIPKGDRDIPEKVQEQS